MSESTEDKAAKAGARHSASDQKMLQQIHDHAEALGAVCPGMAGDAGNTPAEPMKAGDLPIAPTSPAQWFSMKALPNRVLEVKVAFGGPFGGKDAHKEFFSPRTDFDIDNFPAPPAALYHGYDTKTGKPSTKPVYVGKTIGRETRADGHYLRVQLNDGPQADEVYQSAQNGGAPASPGTIGHLIRKDESTGELLYWPIGEISIWPKDSNRQPANPYSVALPALKALYAEAGLTLPTLADTPQADPPGADSAGAAGNAAKSSPTKEQGILDMTPEELKALLDQRDADNAAKAAQLQAAQKAEQEKIDAAVKAALTAREAEFAKANRLPLGGQAPYQAKYGDTWRYDNLDPADNALMISVLGEAHKAGTSKRGYSEGAAKALVLKLGEAKDEVYAVAQNAMKAAGIVAAKANELDYSTQVGFGDEWVGVAYSTRLWERIRQATFVLQKLMPMAIEIPQGMESIYLPLEGADMTFYKVAETTGINATTGTPDATVPSSKIATDRAQLTLAKMGARTIWSGEMEESSLIPFVAQLRMQLEKGAAETMEHVIIDGDTATGATTNINDIGGTPAGTEAFLLVNGFRKSPLVTTTANSRSAGALTAADYLETVKLMGLAGRNADKNYTDFIVDLWTYWKTLELAEVKTRDVNIAATIENGELTRIYGYNLYRSAFMHNANQDATYGLKANTSGKVDLDTASNNTTGSILAVRWDQWRFGIRRLITIETTRVPRSDSTEIVALTRFGLTQRDTEASAISYAVTL